MEDARAQRPQLSRRLLRTRRASRGRGSALTLGKKRFGMIFISITTIQPATVLRKIDFGFSNVVSAMRHWSLRSAGVKIGLRSHPGENKNCRSDFRAFARAATEFSVSLRRFKSPNKASEPTAIIPPPSATTPAPLAHL